METVATLQRNSLSGDVNCNTTVVVRPLHTGDFFVEQTTLLRRAYDGARLQTNVTVWSLDDDAAKGRLVDRLTSTGFKRVIKWSQTEAFEATSAVASALFGWMNV